MASGAEAERTSSSPPPGQGRVPVEATPLKGTRPGARAKQRKQEVASKPEHEGSCDDDVDLAPENEGEGPEDDVEQDMDVEQEMAGSDDDHLSGEEDLDEEPAVEDEEKAAEAPKEEEKVAEAPKDEEKVAEAPKEEEKVAEAQSDEEKQSKPSPEGGSEGTSADGYPEHAWDEESPSISPGLEGFNSRSTAVMRKVGVCLPVQQDQVKDGECHPLQPHQKAVGFLLHPKSPVTRLLIDHPTGSGKTREIIKVLDNYFHDPRPKVPIFPRHPVCRNFYSELLRWPNRYRDYYCCERPEDAVVVSRRDDWREVRAHTWDLGHLSEEESRRVGYAIREVLEMKNMFYMGRMRASFREEFERKHPGEQMPAAPMRALSYTSAGGCFTQISEKGLQPGLPASALMKIGYEKGSRNVYTNKVVVMDEVHNLVRTNTQYAEQLRCLRDLLFRAGSLVLGGFTGTPILNEPAEGRQLLDIIKGEGAPSCDEGFLSSFPFRPRRLFPESLPRGIPDAILTPQLQKQLVTKVELHEEALRTYERKRRLGHRGRRLRAYCNVSVFFGSFHDGKSGTKERILATPASSCPKLYKIAQDVAESPQKALILISRQTGYIVMLELMRMVASQSDPPFEVATIENLAEFNHVSNLRGEKYRVLVADASQCSEGVSFFGVRRTLLADVPSSPSQFVQQCGRAIRMYGHRGLPEEEQTVTNSLYVAALPRWMDSELSCWSLRAQRQDMAGKDLEESARALTSQLQRGGITTLAKLKAQVDAHGSKKRMSLRPGGNPMEKEVLSTKDMVLWLEMSGLIEAEPATQAAKANTGNKRKAEGASTRKKRAVAPRQSWNDSSSWASGSARLAALSARLGISLGGANLESVKKSVESSILSKANIERSLSNVSTSAGSSTGSAGSDARSLQRTMSSASSFDGIASQRSLQRTVSNVSNVSSLDGIASQRSLHRTLSAASMASVGSELDGLLSQDGPSQDVPSSQEGPSSQDAVDSQRVAPAAASDGSLISAEELSALGTALDAAARACESLDGGATLTATAATLAEAMRDVRESRRVAATIRAALPHKSTATDLTGLTTAAQVRVLRERLARAHTRGSLSRAMDAVRTACEEVSQSPQDEAWREKLDELLTLQKCTQVKEAIEAAAPGACQDSGALRGLSSQQLRPLLGELVRRKAEAGSAVGNSRGALVRAAQELYTLPSADRMAESFSTETADEEALRELADRTREFASALTELRAAAIDREIFAHWRQEAEDMDCCIDEPQEQPDASSLQEAGPEARKPLTPVQLPPGWKLKWESRGQTESSLFLDPRGKRYRKVSELRAALAGGGQAAAAAAAAASGRSSKPAKAQGPSSYRRQRRW